MKKGIKGDKISLKMTELTEVLYQVKDTMEYVYKEPSQEAIFNIDELIMAIDELETIRTGSFQ